MTYPLEPMTNVSTRSFPWWIPLVVGAIVTAAGVGLLVWPFVAATWILVILFGSALIANGLALLVRLRPSGSTTAAGLLLILAGILAIVFSEFTVSALVTFVGVTLIFVGALWLVIGIRLTDGRSMLVLLPAVLTLIGGVVTLVWPDFAIKVVAVICGIFTVMLGASIIWTAWRLRKTTVSETTIIVE
ncbi:DUF308 domain-containing protein [Leucobacter sp. W1478]|uniref:DUF308 domain-containing protein n=1 Tax=Leucobacter sp. W1478 TaxID=3439065 RepID=UPI003F393007